MNPADGVIVLDKPAGITSFQAVERVGRLFRGRKCGHAGTLDPLATGVLPVCVGRATKIAGYLAAQEKEYDVFFRFGVETDTGDSTGREIGGTPGKVAEEDAVALRLPVARDAFADEETAALSEAVFVVRPDRKVFPGLARVRLMLERQGGSLAVEQKGKELILVARVPLA